MKNELKGISAQRIKECLAEYNHGEGMTQQELSNRTGIGKSNISHYISGVNTPSNIKAGLMADVFGVNPVWLMGFDVMKYVPDLKPETVTFDTEIDKAVFLEMQTMSIKEKKEVLKYAKLIKYSSMVDNNEE